MAFADFVQLNVLCNERFRGSDLHKTVVIFVPSLQSCMVCPILVCNNPTVSYLSFGRFGIIPAIHNFVLNIFILHDLGRKIALSTAVEDGGPLSPFENSSLTSLKITGPGDLRYGVKLCYVFLPKIVSVCNGFHHACLPSKSDIN